jgi:hypothetical protein
MSDPSETSDRPSASSIQQPGGLIPSLTASQRRRKPSHSLDEPIGSTKATASRRRPGTRKETNPSSRGDHPTMQRSTSPSQMSPDSSSVHYTRTGRISKAKKGLKVHNCDCGRVSSIFHYLERPAWACSTRYATTPRSREALSYTTPLPHASVPHPTHHSFSR